MPLDIAPIGSTVWVVGDGYIPPGSSGTNAALHSHESVCMLNAGDVDATVEISVYYTDQEPAGPYTLTIPARRAYHQQLNALRDPEPIEPGRDYCLVIRSSSPIVVQHTRLDSRQAELALMSTIAFPAR